MAVNKVVMNTENGAETLIDLTNDTVTADTLAEGVTAHDASGKMIIGTMPIASDVIPDYWQTHLDERVDDIRVAMESAGRNKSAFLFYTDAHWGYGSGMSPNLLKYLRLHTAMNRVTFGGDFSNDYEDPDTGKTEEDWVAVMREYKRAIRDLPNHHSVIGNHDANGNIQYLNDHLYGMSMASEESHDIVRGGDFYYYIDEPNEKTRYLYLNTSFCVTLTGSGENGQGQFVADTLASTPEGWHIVVISHIWFLYADVATPTVGDVPNYCKALLNLFDAYNKRGSGSITIGSESVPYDFADKGGRVEFCIGGHTHVDYDFTSTDGIPVILTATDSYHLRGSSLNPRDLGGTTNEASVSGIIADYDAKKIHVVRIGRGDSREIEVTINVVNYTNQLPIALGADGVSIYNANDTPGYKANTRWSASGDKESTSTGIYLTGWIPVTSGDVVYLKNVTMPTGSGENSKVHFFNNSFAAETASSNGTQLDSYQQAVRDGNGNLIQFTVPNDCTHIRIQSGGMDSASIITINEPIE